MPLPGLTAAEEDYLLAIARLGRPARTSELARALEVADSSVTLMVARLAAKGLVSQSPHRPARLTDAGLRVCARLLRRHRLLELFLLKVLDYPWDEVHKEAHALEHAVSSVFIDRVARLLENPAVDPHGQPIPRPDDDHLPPPRKPLSMLNPPAAAQVLEVDDHTPDLLRYLSALGMVPGTVVTILERDPFGALTVSLRGEPVQISPALSEHIFVRELK